MKDEEYKVQAKRLWDIIHRDFHDATIVQIKDEEGRDWPIPLSLILDLPKLVYDTAKALTPANEKNKNAVRDAQKVLIKRDAAKKFKALLDKASHPIVYTPPEGSHYTGFLSGICYVDGKQVTEEEFRADAINLALKRAEELKKK